MNKFLQEALALARGGYFSDAADRCRKSIKHKKDPVAARQILADCLHNLGIEQTFPGGSLSIAEQHFRSALASDPDHLDTLSNLGTLLAMGQRNDEAVVLYRRALKLAGSNTPIRRNLAKILEASGRLDEASKQLQTLAQLEPANAAAYLVREALLVQKVVPSKDYISEARDRILEKLRHIQASGSQLSDPLLFPSTYFALSYHGLPNKDLVALIAKIYLDAAPSLGWQAPHVASWAGPSGRIRIGIASAFFRSHSIGNTSRGLVEQLDRELFEVVLIRLEPSNGDETATAIDASADQVVTLGVGGLDSTRQKIADLKLDVLFYQDIGMEPLSYMLAFARLAPVQLTSFGHPDTTGIPNLDYFLSSANYEVEQAQDHYREQLVLLPDAGTLSYYHLPPAASGLQRGDFGLDRVDTIYLCPQVLYKIHPDMDAIFRGILEQDSSAKIVLIDPGQENMRPLLEARLKQSLGELVERVVFLSALPYLDFLSLVACADVILDTVHFNGQNTNLEAFSMGVPVVTWPGILQRERHTYGMYLAMGFMDLVADSEADYIRLAVRVAKESGFRVQCKARISDACHVLFNNHDFLRSTEKAIVQMVNTAAVNYRLTF